MKLTTIDLLKLLQQVDGEPIRAVIPHINEALSGYVEALSGYATPDDMPVAVLKEHVDALGPNAGSDVVGPRLMDLVCDEIEKRVVLEGDLSGLRPVIRPHILAFGGGPGQRVNDRELARELARLDREGFAFDLVEHLRANGSATQVFRMNKLLTVAGFSADAAKPGGEADEERPGGDEVAGTTAGQPAERGRNGESGNDEYRPAYWLDQRHGVKQNRLSEAVSAGKVRVEDAPPGMSTEGKAVRKLYNVGDALRHCAPDRRTPRNCDRV